MTHDNTARTILDKPHGEALIEVTNLLQARDNYKAEIQALRAERAKLDQMLTEVNRRAQDFHDQLQDAINDVYHLKGERATLKQALQWRNAEVETLKKQIEGLKADLDGWRKQLQKERDEFQDWKQRATEIAHRYADEHGLCETFDECMKEIGLPPRTKNYWVDVEICTKVTVQVDGVYDEDGAIEEVTIDLVREELRANLDHYVGPDAIEDKEAYEA